MAFATIGEYVATQDTPLPFEPMARERNERMVVVVIRNQPNDAIRLLVMADVAEEMTESFYHHAERRPVSDDAYIGRQCDGSPFCLRWEAVEAIY
jgi:hypothetical protein